MNSDGPWLNAAVIAAFIFGIAANLLWYAIKAILYTHGYKVHPLYWQGRDMQNFRELISQEELNWRAKVYKVIRLFAWCSFGLFFVVPLGILTVSYLLDR